MGVGADPDGDVGDAVEAKGDWEGREDGGSGVVAVRGICEVFVGEDFGWVARNARSSVGRMLGWRALRPLKGFEMLCGRRLLECLALDRLCRLLNCMLC